MTALSEQLEPDAMTARCDSSSPQDADVDLLVLFVRPGGTDLPPWLTDLREATRALADGGYILAHRSATASFAARAVLIACVADATHAALRRAGRRVGANHRDATSVACGGLGESADAICGFAAGFAEGRYRFSRYRHASAVPPVNILFPGVASAATDRLTDRLRAVEIVEESVRRSRDLTNTPARDLTPKHLAQAAVAAAAESGAQSRVFDCGWLESEGFAGLCAVGAGSANEPYLIEVSYRGDTAADAAPIILVGKGITFDSGGLSMKSASAMVEMKSDMAGAATALAAVCAIARLRPANAHVVALLAAAENLPGPHAVRPGDILRHRNGRTTEVVNTDCEGRLVLSDVLCWAAERSPAAIIDIATLTYSTIAALGTDITSVMGTDPALVDAIIRAGKKAGDPYWELPLWEPYRRQLESPFADLRNEPDGDSFAGAITAGLFLREFVADAPWAHLDTGGTAYLDAEEDHLAAGATGCGVRSLVQFILDHPFTEQGATR